MSDLGNSRVNIKFNNSVLWEKFFSLLCSNLVLNSFIVYELNNNNFTLKNCLFDECNQKEIY